MDLNIRTGMLEMTERRTDGMLEKKWLRESTSRIRGIVGVENRQSNHVLMNSYLNLFWKIK
jgi:hypothetical protein